MPETSSYSVQASAAGAVYIQQSTVTANSVERATPTLSAAKTGTLTTRTNNTDGTLTMDSGHGFTTSAVIDLFWSGGSRRNVTVGTVSTNSVPISGGSGDNLPTNNTAITAMLPTQVTFAADGTSTAVQVIGACPVNGWVVFRNSTTVVYACQIRAGVLANIWVTGMGSNPISSAAITNVLFSHADSTQSQTLTASVIY